jgi:TadE-like protein
MRSRKKTLYYRGFGAVETLVAVPVVLFLALGLVQWGLVFQGRYAVTYALQEAARAGATGNAKVESIESGLARGLLPYLYGANDIVSYQTNRVRAIAHVQLAQATGFARLKMLSPTEQSFSDWARPARDTQGDLIDGLVEIPNDNLSGLASLQRLSGTSSASRLGYAIGAASGQSLTDANVLKLELTYGLPLIVPFVGRLTAAIMQRVDGCMLGSSQRNSDPGFVLSTPRPWTCPFYESINENGDRVPRLPILVSAQARMQTPAQRSGLVAGAVQVAPGGQSYGVGQVDASDTFRAPDWSQTSPVQNLVNRGQPGYLQFGADRAIQVPQACSNAG